MFGKQEPFLEVAGSEQRVVGWPKRQPVVELAPAAGLQFGPSKGASPAGMMGPVPSGVGRQGVALPAGLLSLMLLGNSLTQSVFTKGETFFMDVVWGWGRWFISFAGPTAEEHRLLTVTSENGGFVGAQIVE